MRTFAVACVVLSLVSGAAQALTYTWIGPNAGSWDCGTYWDQGSVPGAADKVVIKNATYVSVAGNKTIGELFVDNGSYFSPPSGGWTLNVVDDCGATGDFVWPSAHRLPDSGLKTWVVNVDGHFLEKWTGGWNDYSSGAKIVLKGPNDGSARAFLFRGSGRSFYIGNVQIMGTYYDNGSIESLPNNLNRDISTLRVTGGRIVARPNGADSSWVYRRFIFDDGQSNLPPLKANVDFVHAAELTDNGTRNLVVTGGVTYPRDLLVGSPYMVWSGATFSKPKTPYEWRMTGGSFTVGRDFKFLTVGSYLWPGGDLWLHTVDNQTGVSVDFTVKRNFQVGSATTSDTSQEYAAKLYNSKIEVDCDIVIGINASLINGTLQMDNAVIRLGGNFYFGRAPRAWAISNWSPGTSRLICDGNGTDASLGRMNQTLTTYGDCGIALGSLIIQNECGTVSLANSTAGILRLAGDLRLEKGKFNDNDRAIFFNGPNHTLFWDNNLCKITGTTPNALDNIILLPNAVVTLDAGSFSTIKMDNIEMQSGSRLYLNGFTLKADGKTWISDQVENTGVGYEQGTIFGTLVVPEPATLLLIGTGVVGLLGCVRRRRMT